MLIVRLVIIILLLSHPAWASDYRIGAYYFPGWASNSEYWKDLKGLPDSRSPGRSWPDREPLLGYGYPEESVRVAEQHIEWASRYGLSFFVYDWYWNGAGTYLDHAISNFMKAKNKKNMNFCLMWANHSDVPQTGEQFDNMVRFWVHNYFGDPQYLQIDKKPVVVIFGVRKLQENSLKLGVPVRDLFARANAIAAQNGYSGIYFTGAAFAYPYMVNDWIQGNSYSAMTAYNYDNSGFAGDFRGKERYATSYQELIGGYQSQWSWILENSSLPYFMPLSAGWDRRPWGQNTPHDNCSSTPDSFKKMLVAAKAMMDRYPAKTKRIGIVYAWNEFGEGGYIEPTKKWGFKYLQAIKDVFGK